jgi:hypothetical protein
VPEPPATLLLGFVLVSLVGFRARGWRRMAGKG